MYLFHSFHLLFLSLFFFLSSLIIGFLFCVSQLNITKLYRYVTRNISLLLFNIKENTKKSKTPQHLRYEHSFDLMIVSLVK